MPIRQFACHYSLRVCCASHQKIIGALLRRNNVCLKSDVRVELQLLRISQYPTIWLPFQGSRGRLCWFSKGGPNLSSLFDLCSESYWTLVSSPCKECRMSPNESVLSASQVFASEKRWDESWAALMTGVAACCKLIGADKGAWLTSLELGCTPPKVRLLVPVEQASIECLCALLWSS